ncbi:DUF1993 domain-containing protein [Parasphingopyxis lamellibrachiae]|uniref:DUF1993 domain-containing protein n=1 Tax=Parasphingopyxis lamellibrachiae TaxID=680125 RepID=A0A3D9FHW8_9SPHN|nr:DUF1993 domain-containing protein [Parasphingopyxis lamellibrachiae]RED17380.1 hypothetical protein DFR46_2427 [Parasphingopyxis lamellibrachiae]
MSISLYDAVIPANLQIIGSVSGLLDKAKAFCAAESRSEEDMLQAKLIEDMLPFAYQVKAVAEHSLGAIEGVRAGNYSPDLSAPPANFAGLKAKLAAAASALEALDRAEVDAFAGNDMQFSFGEMVIPFLAENFLLSFAQPNFYFHATTAYDILRAEGVSIGKRDFLGQLRMKTAS